MNSNTVDLIATDPPFNKSKDFHATPDRLNKSDNPMFQDRWSWERDVHETWTDQLANGYREVLEAIESARYAHSDSMGAYMCFMAVRLLEMKRILKPTGSIYLHCDPTASHYLKAIMDAIFGHKNFISDIVWKRYAAHSLAKSGIDTISDHLLFYSEMGDKYSGDTITEQLKEKELRKRFKHREKETGRWYQHVSLEKNANASSAGQIRVIQGKEVISKIGWVWSQKTFDERLKANPYLIYWTGTGRPRYKLYRDEYKGRPVGNIWTDVRYLSSNDSERTIYPTQKPEELYQRIIKASSSKGDIVLDPFCGCATTCVAAELERRKWIGIDIWKGAHQLVIDRIKKHGLSQEGEYSLTLFSENFHYRTDLPERTDEGEVAGEKFDALWVAPKEAWQKPNNREMKEKLVEWQKDADSENVVCAGCGRRLEKEFMELDHIQPKSGYGTNFIDNRILLCRPCNGKKSNRLTMDGLWTENRQDNWMRNEARAKKAGDQVRRGVANFKREMSMPNV